ncbi:MAG TPA: tetratricopeptide repeat protein [Planctomycetota bacterium]|nr:tetratricopeptide repeat protein [Planctomycetota bacterium]
MLWVARVDYSKHLEKADEALRRKNFDFAIEVYQQLLELEPDLGEARRGLRQALRKRFEAKGGGRLMRALSGAVPLATAKTLRKAGRNDACAKSLESYLASNPLDEDANLLLGLALDDAGHKKSALAVYEFVAELAPKNSEALKRAGALMYRGGDHVRALEYYERALKADPRDQEALKARKDLSAEAALTKTNFENVSHSRDMMANKEETRALERSRRLHLSDEELASERTRLETKYADNPTDPDVMLELADIAEKSKDLETASSLVDRALSYRKTSFDLICRAGDLRAKLLKKAIARADKAGQAEEAARLERELIVDEARDYRQRVEAHPSDLALRVQLGKRLLRADDADAALAELQKATADARHEREARALLAQCFEKKGFLDLARKEYERALGDGRELDQRAKEILYNLAGIAIQEGDSAQARSFYARIYEVDVGFRDVASKMNELRGTPPR